MSEHYVVGLDYANLIVDARVTSELIHCIYCSVYDSHLSVTVVDYRISLDCINGAGVKQCPACRRVYILTAPGAGLP